MPREFGKLFHQTPLWVTSAAKFHIRIRTDSAWPSTLVQPAVAEALLKGFVHYHDMQKWYAWLVVIMPDHIHALISFPPEGSMSQTIGTWKSFHKRTLGIKWQDNYFDHRIRHADEFEQKALYIRMNPVRAGLCEKPEEWAWTCQASDQCPIW